MTSDLQSGGGTTVGQNFGNGLLFQRRIRDNGLSIKKKKAGSRTGLSLPCGSTYHMGAGGHAETGKSKQERIPGDEV